MNLTARVGQKMKLDNGTVVMDIQKTFSSQSDETGVVLISLQYESGLFNFLMVRLLPSSKKHQNISTKKEWRFLSNLLALLSLIVFPLRFFCNIGTKNLEGNKQFVRLILRFTITG